MEVLCPHRVVAFQVVVDNVASVVGHSQHQHVPHERH